MAEEQLSSLKNVPIPVHPAEETAMKLRCDRLHKAMGLFQQFFSP